MVKFLPFNIVSCWTPHCYEEVSSLYERIVCEQVWITHKFMHKSETRSTVSNIPNFVRQYYRFKCKFLIKSSNSQISEYLLLVTPSQSWRGFWFHDGCNTQHLILTSFCCTCWVKELMQIGRLNKFVQKQIVYNVYILYVAFSECSCLYLWITERVVLGTTLSYTA